MIVDNDSVELVHTSCCAYENPINEDLAETVEWSSEENSPNESPREDPLTGSGSTVVLHGNSEDHKPIVSFLSSGISTGSYEPHESAINQEPDSIRISNTNLIIVSAEREGLVQAVPIGPYHVPHAENDKPSGGVQLIEPSADPIRAVTEPNSWIWSSNSVSSSETDPSRVSGHVVTATLVRCLSQDNLAQSCPNVGKRRNSGPSLTQNSYENVHISLANHRTVGK